MSKITSLLGFSSAADNQYTLNLITPIAGGHRRMSALKGQNQILDAYQRTSI